MNESPRETVKSKIVKIGTFNEFGIPVGWAFDCAGIVAGIEICSDDQNWGGYTRAELVQISQQEK